MKVLFTLVAQKSFAYQYLRKRALTLNKNFFCGYSPERVVPGDKSKRVENITKITSGSNEFASNFINELYASVILAGTYPAKV